MRGLAVIACIAFLAMLFSSAGCCDNDCQRLYDWLADGRNYGKLTVADWKVLDEYKRTSLVRGILVGDSVGQVLVKADVYPLEKQKERLYLLNGWGMKPSAFVIEAGALLDEQTGKDEDKSYIAALVSAEARFAELAGEYDRARALKDSVPMLLLHRALASDDPSVVLSPKLDNAKVWHDVFVCFDWAESFVKGFVEGIELQRAIVTSGIKLPVGFRVGQIRDEMDALLKSNYGKEKESSLLRLFIAAEASLVEAAKSK